MMPSNPLSTRFGQSVASKHSDEDEDEVDDKVFLLSEEVLLMQQFTLAVTPEVRIVGVVCVCVCVCVCVFPSISRPDIIKNF
jgi:hypothetical protein